MFNAECSILSYVYFLFLWYHLIDVFLYPTEKSLSSEKLVQINKESGGGGVEKLYREKSGKSTRPRFVIFSFFPLILFWGHRKGEKTTIKYDCFLWFWNSKGKAIFALMLWKFLLKHSVTAVLNLSIANVKVNTSFEIMMIKVSSHQLSYISPNANICVWLQIERFSIPEWRKNCIDP